ncbi:MAG TPA: hypothetical protein VL463_30985 [Kofleriaceae bacterium]|nr:hypothetical protein [Kofleriaceae bacterium]
MTAMKKLLLLLLIAGCRVKDPPAIKQRWIDTFAREAPGADYYQTGSGYRIADGALNAHGAHNKPLWLRKKLPHDVQIDLTTWSNSPDGDIKVEVFGDGRYFDPDAGDYTSTGYVFIFGGWHNTESIIVKGYEHGTDKTPPKTSPKVEPGKKYHWRIVRKGSVIDWFIDDMNKPFLEYNDPNPWSGPGHEYFAFSNWETDTWFDDLTITPISPSS